MPADRTEEVLDTGRHRRQHAPHEAARGHVLKPVDGDAEAALDPASTPGRCANSLT
jgi:hypothetical protein